MPRRIRLNEKSVREAEPVSGKDYQVFDTVVRGFAICIYRSGSRAFTIDYSSAGRQRRMTIVSLFTTGLLLALIAGIAVKLKLFG